MAKSLISSLGVLLIMNAASANVLPDFDSLWNYDKPAETEAEFRHILTLAEKSSDTLYVLELKTQIARTLSLQQKFDEAHAMLDEVDSALAAQRAGSSAAADSPSQRIRVRVRSRLERGRTFNSSKQKDKALVLFEEAWNLAREAGLDFYAVDAAHMLAIAAPPEQVMEWNQKALALAEKSSDPKAHRWRGSLYNNIGWDYFGRGEYDSALTMFESALRARIEQEKPAEIRIAKWCVAKTLRRMQQVDSALVIQRSLEIEWHDSDEGPDGYVFEEIAECLLALGKREDAQAYFAQAYQLLSTDPWLVRDEPERLARLKEFGQTR